MANTIQTERLTLIPLTKDHLDAYHAVWSDPEATQWSLRGRSVTLEDSKDWMIGILRTPANDSRRSWAVYNSNELESDQCIGIVSLRAPDNPANEKAGSSKAWELGYLYRPQYWGKGYATESCIAAIESLRKDVDACPDRSKVKVIANVDPCNEGSLKVLEKLDFQMVEHKKLGGPQRFLGGQWREDGYMVFERDLWIEQRIRF